MKCPKCSEEMMALGRRDSAGLWDELCYRCLYCGVTTLEKGETVDQNTPRIKRRSHWQWKAAVASVSLLLVLATVMQMPVSIRVFAVETSIDPAAGVLPYVNLINLTASQYRLNYTDERIMLQIAADYASATSSETVQNVTIYKILMGKVSVGYRDSDKTFEAGFSSLIMSVRIKHEDLSAYVEGTAYVSLWTAIMNMFTGQVA